MRNGQRFDRSKVSNRGAVLLEEFQLLAQARLAEELMASTGGSSKGPMSKLVELGPRYPARRRQRFVARLMNTDLSTGRALSARDRMRMRRMADPTSKVPMVERAGTARAVADALTSGVAKDPTTPDEQRDFLIGLLGEFQPVTTHDDEDGRPDDADPGDPTADLRPGRPQIAVDISPPKQPRLVPYSKLDFVIEEVICVNTTRGEAGKDEISISGGAVSAPLNEESSEMRSTRAVLPITAVGQFGRSTIASLTPPFHTFELDGLTMPRYCRMFVTMAETDPQGGFDVFMRQFNVNFLNSTGFDEIAYFQGVGDLVASAGFSGLAGLLIQLETEVDTPAEWEVLSGLLGGLVASVISLYFSFGGNEDEIFNVEQSTVYLTRNALDDHPFYGGTRSPTDTLNFEGDSGLYEVNYHWELRDPVVDGDTSDETGRAGIGGFKS